MAFFDTDSILLTVKKRIGDKTDDDAYNPDIIPLINNALFDLSQFAFSPDEPVIIYGPEEHWSDYFPAKLIAPVSTYVALKTKLVFDTPASSAAKAALEAEIAQTEWRLNFDYETGGS